MNRSISLASAFVLASLSLACASQSAQASRAAVDGYTQRFAASQPKPIDTAVEVTAPRLEPQTDGTLRLSGADSARPVAVRLLDQGRWTDVKQVWIQAGETTPAVDVKELPSLLSAGITAREAEIKLVGGSIEMQLTDVDLYARGAHADWVRVTLDFGSRFAMETALVATLHSAINAPTGHQLAGGD